MSTYRLEKFFAAGSVAVAGASEREGALGGIVLKGLRDGGYKGTLQAVNPKYQSVHGLPCFRSIKEIQPPPDLVIVATPAHAVESVIADAIAAKVAASIILTAGLGRGSGSIASNILSKATASGLRIIGPNCLGVISPPASLNASFAMRAPRPGPLALVSQSGAIATGVVEWAIKNNLGFSGIVSLGDAIDVDFGDCLDYFAEDTDTRAIMLYVEGINDARKFMSAARKAARVKPVIVLKGGRHSDGAKAAATHTGALAGSDAVYKAAFHRAGCIRAVTLDEFFAGANVFATQPAIQGDRVAILTNGGGLGVLAVDLMADNGLKPAQLSDATMKALNACLPSTWSNSNPVDIIGDAPPHRYANAMKALLEEPGADAIIAMNCPTALTSAQDAAEAISAIVQEQRKSGRMEKPVFGVWLGSDVRHQFQKAGIASFETEEPAIHGLTQMIAVHRAQQELLKIPPRLVHHDNPDRDAVYTAIQSGLTEGREWLTPVEISHILAAYQIPAAAIHLAQNENDAARIAQQFLAQGQQCVVKIQSPDIVHKSDVDGVRLSLSSTEAVYHAAASILDRARTLRPQARIDGVTIQPMIQKPHARELIAGVTVDPTFGPIILFGHGGTAVEVIDDKALALLPLDINQAMDLIHNTRVSRLLKGYRNVPGVDENKLAEILVRISRLVEDNPEIYGLDLNPLLADETGFLALDARIQVKNYPTDRQIQSSRRFAIRPYPRHLEERVQLQNGQYIAIRPLRPSDQQALTDMLRQCAPEDVRMRFFSRLKSLDQNLLARLTQIDYAREMAFVAINPATKEILGVVRLHGDANHDRAEYAILIKSNQQGTGIGHALMNKIIKYGKAEEYRQIYGSVLKENLRMTKVAIAHGFEILQDDDDHDIVMTKLNLN